MDAVRSFGTLWHLCLFVWSSILVILVREHVSVVATRVNNGLFLFSVFLLLLYFSVLKNFGLFRKTWFRKVRKITKIILFATTPAFFVLNMWIPIQRRVSCSLNILYPSKYNPREEICPFISVLLASIFTVLVMIHQNKQQEHENLAKMSITETDNQSMKGEKKEGRRKSLIPTPQKKTPQRRIRKWRWTGAKPNAFYVNTFVKKMIIWIDKRATWLKFAVFIK